jgi:5-methyltetrahydropteroyltriglutamate--homocysteine methyltransferase
MINSYDVGSIPFKGDKNKFEKEAASYSTLRRRYFEEKIVKDFEDKCRIGLEIPNYPQYRDMISSILEMIDGIEKHEGRYIITNNLNLNPKKKQIEEIVALRLNSKILSEKIQSKVKIKMCLAGPYTISSYFSHIDSFLFPLLADIISEVINETVFREKNAEVSFFTLDEPLLGVIDDVRLDHGSEGREILIKSLEKIFSHAKCRGLETSMHLHSSTLPIFWDIKSLGVIESHLHDQIYSSNQTKVDLEKNDKFLKACIARTDFDSLIGLNSKKMSSKEMSVENYIGDTWRDIKQMKIDPKIFLEETQIMEKRLLQSINNFGIERVAYAGPECGLKGFPNYDCAIELLKRICESVDVINSKFHRKN